MLKEAIDIYVEARSAHAKLTHDILKLKHKVGRSGGVTDMKELADLALVASDVKKLAEDLESEARQLREISEKVCCLAWMRRGVADNIKTEYVTATPDIKPIPKLPDRRREPEAYGQLMDGLGVPRALWDVGDDRSAVMQPHWNGMQEYVASLMQQGKPLPPGVSQTSGQVFRLRLHRRKEVSGEMKLLE